MNHQLLSHLTVFTDALILYDDLASIRLRSGCASITGSCCAAAWCHTPPRLLCTLLHHVVNIVNNMLLLQELRREVEVMDGRGARGEGQRLVARAWVDPGFKKRLLQVMGLTAGGAGCDESWL